MGRLTPQYIESKWLDLESGFAEKMAQKSDFLRLVAIGLLGFLILTFTREWWENSYPDWTYFFLVSHRFNLTLALFVFSYLTYWLRHPAYLIFAQFAVWSYNLYQASVQNPWAFAYPIYFAVSYLLIRQAFKKRSVGWWDLSLFAVVGGFIASMYIAGHVGLSSGSYFLELFWILHPEYAFLALLYLWISGKQKQRSIYPEVALAPTQVSYPLPIPVVSRFTGDDPSRMKYLWWLGYGNFVQGIVIFLLSMVVAKIPMSSAPILSATHKFLYFGMNISATMGLTTGLIRMYGFDAPAASHFLFFASSPLDVWRRGSVYMYRAVLDLIFMPMMRKTKSLLLTTIACLVFILSQMFLMHEFGVKAFYSLVFSEFNSAVQFVPQVLWGITYFAGGWLALILLYRITIVPLFKRLGHSEPGWIQVIVTQCLVILLMSFLLK